MECQCEIAGEIIYEKILWYMKGISIRRYISVLNWFKIKQDEKRERTQLKQKQILANIMLFLAALIWGSSFSIVKIGFRYMTPFFLNGLRFAAAALFVLVLFLITRRKEAEKAESRLSTGRQIRAGMMSGTALAVGAALQQWGLMTVTASNTGFITALYTIFVPFLSFLIFHKKIKRQVWAAAGLALLGMFLISAGGGFQVQAGDIAVFAGAIGFSAQILIIGCYIERSNPYLLSVSQLSTGGIWSFFFSILFESGNTAEGVISGLWVVLLTGILSLGVAHTLQILAQKHAEPSVTAIILSLEAVFGALFGAILLGESLNPLQAAGCASVFFAIILSQVELKTLKRLVKIRR